ncbi:hypothetical protein LCGC14_0561920 [marine sediment metagenome]|uniref:Uncharacterized protein n=1 Tax=marine sediment metagenome TaxID=412755 RepID=A0A0F9RLQ7_9ZZZZ
MKYFVIKSADSRNVLSLLRSLGIEMERYKWGHRTLHRGRCFCGQTIVVGTYHNSWSCGKGWHWQKAIGLAMHCLSVDKPGAIAILNGCFYETRPKPTFVDMNVLTVVADEFKERAEAMLPSVYARN